VGPTRTPTGGVGSIDEGFELVGPTGTATGGVGTIDEGFEPTDPVETNADGPDKVIEFLGGVNSVINGVCTANGGFELTCVLTGGVGAIDGFLVAINSEIGCADGTDAFDGYRKKIYQILFIYWKKVILMKEKSMS